jgi:hypothetical protein
VIVVTTRLVVVVIIMLLLFLVSDLFPGTSPSTAVIPTAQASSFRLQYFSYYM